MRFTSAARLARKMISDGGKCSLNGCPAGKPKSPEVIMSRDLKSFAEMSLKVVAVRTANDSDFEFEFPASGPLSTPSTLTTPLEQSAEGRRHLLPEILGWYHGGIND